jgi:homopolymeric O-antigen transport system permease protein
MTTGSQGGEGDRWDLVITPQKGWFDIDIAGVWRYRELVLLFFKRDFVAFYKQTVLGPLWYLIQPTLTTLAFTLVFSRIARLPTDNVPPFLFYMSGVVIWNFFGSALNKTSDTFASNAAIFGKVYFPRLVVPVSVVVSNMLTFAMQFLLLLCVIGYVWIGGTEKGFAGPLIVLVVPLLLYISVFALGIGMIVSSLTVRYRDLAFVVGFATQLWMYATPVVYPLSHIPAKWQWLFALNPMTAPVETFRLAVLGAGTVTPVLWLSSAGMTVVTVVLGLMLFSRAEKVSMDTV